MAICTMCRKEREHFRQVRKELFRCEKGDVVIYEYEGRYVINLINKIEISDRIYNTLSELFEDSLSRHFYDPYEMTDNDWKKLYELKSSC